MAVRDVLLLGAVFGGGAVALVTACTGPDPGAIVFSERPAGPGEPQGGSSGTSGAPSDAGGDAGAAADSIFGTTAFAYEDPGVAANSANALHAGTVEGKNCIVAGCHLDGNRPWLFAGTLYTTSAGTTTVPRGEVKIVGPDGATVGAAFTDANGNFWFEAAGSTIPAGSLVGVRREGGGAPRKMATALNPTDSGCSAGGTCHGGSTGRVYAD